MIRKKNRNRQRGQLQQHSNIERPETIKELPRATPVAVAGLENAYESFGPENTADAPTQVANEINSDLALGDNMFNVKPANLWMAEQSLQPIPKKLFGGLWLQGELCLMYADTNMGKSILAVQIGDSISRGAAIAPFKLQTGAEPTLYIDFELSAKQFEMRYRLNDTAHQFSPEFYRAEYNAQATMPANYDNFAGYINQALDRAIRQTAPRILIIDNITCLTEGNHQAAAAAVALMKHLKTLQATYQLSILVLAHTHKRDAAKPLTRNDMGGSKMLMNFADSAFAIGQSSTDADLRYLKQMKQRSGNLLYGEDKVCFCRLVREGGFLKYEFDGYGHEYPHLRRNTIANREKVVAESKKLHDEGFSQRQIARSLNVSVSTVNRMLDEQYQEDEKLADELRANFALMRERKGIIPTELQNEQNEKQLQTLINLYEKRCTGPSAYYADLVRKNNNSSLKTMDDVVY